MGNANDKTARNHADKFLRHLHADEWRAVYLAKRRELEGDPNWKPNKSNTRAATMAANKSETTESSMDVLELLVSMADKPLTSVQLAEMTRLHVSTVKRYMRLLEASGRVTSTMPAQWPYHLLWSVAP